MDGRNRLLVVAASVKLAHAHAAETDCGNFGAVAAEAAPGEHEHKSSPFLVSRASLATQAAACFIELKWDRQALMATGLTRNNRHFGTADPECFGDEPDRSVVRRTVGRRFGDADLELLAAVRLPAPVADPRLCRARCHANRKHIGHAMLLLHRLANVAPANVLFAIAAEPAMPHEGAGRHRAPLLVTYGQGAFPSLLGKAPFFLPSAYERVRLLHCTIEECSCADCRRWGRYRRSSQSLGRARSKPPRM